MEKLEEVLKGISIENPELEESEPYVGLELVGESAYKGPSGKKYWM